MSICVIRGTRDSLFEVLDALTYRNFSAFRQHVLTFEVRFVRVCRDRFGADSGRTAIADELCADFCSNGLCDISFCAERLTQIYFVALRPEMLVRLRLYQAHIDAKAISEVSDGTFDQVINPQFLGYRP